MNGRMRHKAVALAIAWSITPSARAGAGPAKAIDDARPAALPRVEIHATPADAAPDAAALAATARSSTSFDPATAGGGAPADWQGLAVEVPGLMVRVGDGGLSTSYALRGHALTRTLLDGLPDVLRLFVRDPATVRRVEVQRGPAGVDQGIGSPGGQIAMRTPAPSAQAAHRVDLQTGSDDWRRLVLDLDQPLDAPEHPHWGSRLVLAAQDGRSDPGGLTQGREHLLGTLAWWPGARPADGGLRLVGERQINRTPYAFGTVMTPAGRIRYDQLYAAPQESSWRATTRLAAHAHLAVEPAQDHRLSLRADIARARMQRDETLIGSWDQRSDGDLNGYYTHIEEDQRQHAARLHGQWQVETDSARHVSRFGLDRLSRHWLLSGEQSVRGYTIDAEEPDFSGFDAATLALSPRHRHQRFDEAGTYARHGIEWPGRLGIAAGWRRITFNEANAAPGAALNTVHRMRSHVHDLTLDHTAASGWQTTLAWAEGVEPNTGRTRDGAWLPPQRSELLELGLRQPVDRGEADAAGSRGGTGLALAFYRIRLQGLTRSDPLDRNYAVADAARQVSGVEGVAPWRHGDWTVVGQLNAMRLRWLQASSASVGAVPANTPARTAALRIERRLIAPGGKVWLQWQGRSSLYADSANRRRIPGTGLIDLGLQGSLGPWQSTLLLRNVADRDHVASVSSVDEVYQGSTRQWRWTLTARW